MNTHLSHESRLSTHVGPGDKDTGGTTVILTIFTGARAANEYVIRYEVVTKKGLGDTGVAGSCEVNEGCELVVILGEYDLGPGHGAVSTLAVAGQGQQHIWGTKKKNKTVKKYRLLPLKQKCMHLITTF